MRNIRRRIACVGFAASALFAAAWTGTAAAADPSFIDPGADWLTVVNYYRAMSGLPGVAENPALSSGAVNHSCYMLYNDITHYEVAGNPGYTVEGEASGKASNVAVTSVINETARRHIELWMTGPYHAIGVLRPNLQTVGFGKCDLASTAKWHSGATLDVIHGLGPKTPQSAPILFPGDGATTSLDHFVVESPNPLEACGWEGSAGLPIIAMMPEGFTSQPTATINGSSGPLDVCVVSAKNTTGSAQSILDGNNAVVVIPRAPLAPDTYTVSVTTSARTVTWSFTVDPAAATGVETAPSAKALMDGAGLNPLTPARVVDTRIDLGASRLAATLKKRIQISGLGGVPAEARAISANFTITNPDANGYLTVWNCASQRPVVSTLNFVAGETVPNGASVPLDANGGICVFSPASSDLIIDVNGFYATSGGGRLASVPPARLLDTRIGLGGAGRLAADSVQTVQVRGITGVPNDASLVALNVTAIAPSLDGFVSVYPCDGAQPTISSLNPVPGKVKANFVVTPVAADGTVCIYTLTEVDLAVDIVGYVSPAAAMRFTSSTPFRLTDTRDQKSAEINAGTNGQPAAQGQVLIIQVAGARGIPGTARAVSANVTVIGAVGPGYATAWPCGERPTTSSLNYVASEAIANGGHLPLSATGQLCVYVSNDVHVIVDVNGWWS